MLLSMWKVFSFKSQNLEIQWENRGKHCGYTNVHHTCQTKPNNLTHDVHRHLAKCRGTVGNHLVGFWYCYFLGFVCTIQRLDLTLDLTTTTPIVRKPTTRASNSSTPLCTTRRRQTRPPNLPPTATPTTTTPPTTTTTLQYSLTNGIGCRTNPLKYARSAVKSFPCCEENTIAVCVDEFFARNIAKYKS